MIEGKCYCCRIKDATIYKNINGKEYKMCKMCRDDVNDNVKLLKKIMGGLI